MATALRRTIDRMLACSAELNPETRAKLYGIARFLDEHPIPDDPPAG